MDNDKPQVGSAASETTPEKTVRRMFPVLVVVSALSVILSVVNLARPAPSLWIPLGAVVLVVATVSVWRWLRSRR